MNKRGHKAFLPLFTIQEIARNVVVLNQKRISVFARERAGVPFFVAALLSSSLIVSALPEGSVLPVICAAETTDYGISNPTTDPDGVTTWDCVYFGNYWQGSGETKEPIKWRVLSVDGDDAFLLSDQNLDCQPYHETMADVTWEVCTLRSWLNGYGSSSNRDGKDYGSNNFIDAAFTPTEQSAILLASVVNDDNSSWETEGGNNTEDMIFLLSAAEAGNAAYGFREIFDKSSETRQSKNTSYVKTKGASTGDEDGYVGNGWWWLRSPGDRSNRAAGINIYGFGNGAACRETAKS